MTTEHRTAFSGASFFWAIVGLCLFSIIALFWLRLNPKPQSYDQKRATVRLKMLRDLKIDDENKLGHYSWVDEKKGILQVPISRAEELVVTELKNKPAQPSAVKVENPYPAGLQPTPTPAPAPVAAPAAKTTEVKK